jgi:hypothetical protein
MDEPTQKAAQNTSSGYETIPINWKVKPFSPLALITRKQSQVIIRHTVILVKRCPPYMNGFFIQLNIILRVNPILFQSQYSPLFLLTPITNLSGLILIIYWLESFRQEFVERFH